MMQYERFATIFLVLFQFHLALCLSSAKTKEEVDLLKECRYFCDKQNATGKYLENINNCLCMPMETAKRTDSLSITTPVTININESVEHKRQKRSATLDDESCDPFCKKKGYTGSLYQKRLKHCQCYLPQSVSYDTYRNDGTPIGEVDPPNENHGEQKSDTNSMALIRHHGNSNSPNSHSGTSSSSGGASRSSGGTSSSSSVPSGHTRHGDGPPTILSSSQNTDSSTSAHNGNSNQEQKSDPNSMALVRHHGNSNSPNSLSGTSSSSVGTSSSSSVSSGHTRHGDGTPTILSGSQNTDSRMRAHTGNSNHEHKSDPNSMALVLHRGNSNYPNSQSGTSRSSGGTSRSGSSTSSNGVPSGHASHGDSVSSKSSSSQNTDSSTRAHTGNSNKGGVVATQSKSSHSHPGIQTSIPKQLTDGTANPSKDTLVIQPTSNSHRSDKISVGDHDKDGAGGQTTTNKLSYNKSDNEDGQTNGGKDSMSGTPGGNSVTDTTTDGQFGKRRRNRRRKRQRNEQQLSLQGVPQGSPFDDNTDGQDGYYPKNGGRRRGKGKQNVQGVPPSGSFDDNSLENSQGMKNENKEQIGGKSKRWRKGKKITLEGNNQEAKNGDHVHGSVSSNTEGYNDPFAGLDSSNLFNDDNEAHKANNDGQHSNGKTENSNSMVAGKRKKKRFRKNRNGGINADTNNLNGNLNNRNQIQGSLSSNTESYSDPFAGLDSGNLFNDDKKANRDNNDGHRNDKTENSDFMVAGKRKKKRFRKNRNGGMNAGTNNLNGNTNNGNQIQGSLSSNTESYSDPFAGLDSGNLFNDDKEAHKANYDRHRNDKTQTSDSMVAGKRKKKWFRKNGKGDKSVDNNNGNANSKIMSNPQAQLPEPPTSASRKHSSSTSNQGRDTSTTSSHEHSSSTPKQGSISSPSSHSHTPSSSSHMQPSASMSSEHHSSHPRPSSRDSSSTNSASPDSNSMQQVRHSSSQEKILPDSKENCEKFCAHKGYKAGERYNVIRKVCQCYTVGNVSYDEYDKTGKCISCARS